MKAKVYAVDQETGEETFQYFSEVADFDDALEIAQELKASGRCWIGSGAAQLFLLMAV